MRLLGAALLAAISKRCGVASKRARLRERAVVCLSQVKCVALCHRPVRRRQVGALPHGRQHCWEGSTWGAEDFALNNGHRVGDLRAAACGSAGYHSSRSLLVTTLSC